MGCLSTVASHCDETHRNWLKSYTQQNKYTCKVGLLLLLILLLLSLLLFFTRYTSEIRVFTLQRCFVFTNIAIYYCNANVPTKI